jgi:hypothetical protein
MWVDPTEQGPIFSFVGGNRKDDSMMTPLLELLTGLVPNECCQVRWLGGVIFGEGFHLTTPTPAALPGAEAQGATPRMLELHW